VPKLKSYIWALGVVAIAFSSCSSSKKASSNNSKSITQLSGREKVAFDETFFNGLSAKYAGDHKTAIGYLQQCLTIDPQSVAVKYELSSLLLQMGYNDGAVEMAQDVVAIDPNNRWYLENLASVYQNTKNYKQSAEVFEKLLTKYPNEIPYYYDLGSSYLYANNPAGAIRTYENLEALTGYDNSLAEQLYKLYEHQKMNEKAEAKLIQLVENNPSEIRYVSMLAAFYKKNGETEKAVSLYEKLKTDHPNDPYVKLALYEYYTELGQTEEAFNNLEAAFSSETVNIDSKMGILLALMDLSTKNESIKTEVYELLDIMAQTHPNDAKTWAVYGDFLYGENKKAESRKMFLKSIAIDDSKYQVWNQVLFVDSELNEVDSIIIHSEKCIALFPNQVLPHYFNGLGYLQNENFKKAILSLENAKNLAFGMPELETQILANLGDAYYQEGQFNKAWISYDNSLRITPSNDYVLNNYAYFLSVHDTELEKALAMSKTTVDNNPKSATYLDTYGWIFYKMKNYPEAVKYLSQAVEFSKSPSAEIYEHLGDALFQNRQVDQAVQNWNKAKEVGGNSENLNYKIANKNLPVK
jgi:tetratricopeptide (TPR) repeat protein